MSLASPELYPTELYPELYPREFYQCQRCPRLVAWREETGTKKRRSYQEEDYWAQPVPGFGDTNAQIMLLGLAPGAHGSNRTGRMFTGDASGNFLFPALHRAGLASQAEATARDDGLSLNNIWITAAARCVPPQNKLKREEWLACQHWLEHDLRLLPHLCVILALGAIAHNAYLDYLKARGHHIVKKHYPFRHAARYDLPDGKIMLDSYHVSFQNTNTGKLTASMFDAVLAEIRALCSH